MTYSSSSSPTGGYNRDTILCALYISLYTPSISFSLSIGSLMMTPFDMANYFVTNFYVYVRFTTLCEHGRFYLVRFEDKHLAFPSTTSDESIFLIDEATT